jgi:hypothetical protein
VDLLLILAVQLQISCNIFEAVMYNSFRTSVKVHAKSEFLQYCYAFSERPVSVPSLSSLVSDITYARSRMGPICSETGVAVTQSLIRVVVGCSSS